MSFSLSSLPSKAEIESDIAKVEEVVALVEKYDGLLPIPSYVKTAVADLDEALKFAASVVADA